MPALNRLMLEHSSSCVIIYEVVGCVIFVLLCFLIDKYEIKFDENQWDVAKYIIFHLKVTRLFSGNNHCLLST